jgi:hypothetical protein
LPAALMARSLRVATTQDRTRNRVGQMMGYMAYSRREIVEILRRTGYKELADEAERDLPDPVESDQLQAFAQAHNIDRDSVIDEMGGSP